MDSPQLLLDVFCLQHRPGAGGEEQREVFESALKSVDATFQNLDSSEISLTDVSHYFDSDPTKLVSGLRTDGKLPSSYIADTTTANAQVCTMSICMLAWPLFASQHSRLLGRFWQGFISLLQRLWCRLSAVGCCLCKISLMIAHRLELLLFWSSLCL